MALINFIDFGGPTIGALYLNDLDRIRNTMTSNATSLVAGALLVGGAAGGYQAPGTINAVGLYVGGVAVLTSASPTPPGGLTTQVQYNNAGAFAGNAAMTFNSGTGTLTLAPTSGNGLLVTQNANNAGISISSGGTNDAVFNLNANGAPWRLYAGGGTLLGAGQFGLYDVTAGAFRMTFPTTGGAVIPAPTSGNTLSLSSAGLGSGTVAALSLTASSTFIAGVTMQSAGKSIWQMYAAGAADELHFFRNGGSDYMTIGSTGIVSVAFNGTLAEVGTRALLTAHAPSTTYTTVAADAGTCLRCTGGGYTFTLDNVNPASTIMTIINAGSSAITISAAASVTWYNGSGSAPTGNRTLAVGGVMTAWATSAGNWSVWGTGLT